MDKHISITVTAELPSNLFEAARAVLGAEGAFNDLKTALGRLGIVAAVTWDDERSFGAGARNHGTRTRATGVWTQERLALLQEEYPTMTTISDIIAHLNALAGPRVASSGQLYRQVHKLNLRRPVVSPMERHAAAMREKRANAAAA